MTRIIVCGGRDFTNIKLVNAVLDKFHATHKITHLFHGNARGADGIAHKWGTSTSGVHVHPIPAQWSKYGKAAGSKRNQAMLGHNPDYVIAFPGGKGTADMVKRATLANIQVIRVREATDVEKAE